MAQRSRLAPKLLAICLPFLCVVLVIEVGLRVALPPSRFLSRQEENRWKHRFLERAERAREQGSAFDNIESDPGLGWRPVRLLRQRRQKTNSKGVRGTREVPYEKPEGTRRIVVMGASVTFGWGLPDHKAYPALLERLLPGYEVLNLGVNGYGTDQQFLYWQQEGKKYDADLVILSLHMDCFHRNAMDFRELPKPRFVLEGDQLRLTGVPVPGEADLLASGVDAAASFSRLLDFLGAGWRSIRRPVHRFDEKAALVEYILRDMAAAVRAAGSEFCVVYIPMSWYREYEEGQRIADAVTSACRKHGIPLLDLTDAFVAQEEADPTKPLYDADETHWTAAGSRCAATAVAEFTRRSGLVVDPGK